MKKFYGILFLSLIFIMTGCEKVAEGDYKEGTYFGYDENSKTTAVLYVNEEGLIKSLFVDCAYLKTLTDGTKVATTKQILGDAYGMKSASSNMGIIDGGAEWYEQINNLTKKRVEEQGLDWFEFEYKVANSDGTYTFTSEKPDSQKEEDKLYTDSVAGVTIHVDGSYNAIKNALEKAAK
jgi:hypothetical protein